jgi:ribonuclease P/MRP protein subunit POP5
VEFIPVGPRKDSYQPLNSRQIWPALKQSILEHFGDTGWGAVGLTLTCMSVPLLLVVFPVDVKLVKYHSPTTNICIIRVARDHHRIAWGAITLLHSIQGQQYIPYVIRVSGRSSRLICSASISTGTHRDHQTCSASRYCS